MRAWLINLERAVDRGDYMRNALARHAPFLTVERPLMVDISARDWTPPSGYRAARWTSDRWSLRPSDIEIFRSHRDAWRRIAETGQPGFVFEDDLLFSACFGAALEAVSERVPDGILRLDGLGRPILTAEPVVLGGGFAIARLNSLAASAAAYCVSPDAAAALVAQNRIERTVDDYLFDPFPQDRGAVGHGLPVYQLVPAVCAQAQFSNYTDGRIVPDFLLATKRTDVSRRRDRETVGPLLYRALKELRRGRARRRLKARRDGITFAGGAWGDPQPAPDLIWT